MVLFEFILAMKFDFGSFLTWLLCDVFSCVFVTFPHGVLSRVWYLIVSILDLCFIPYFHCLVNETDNPINLILLFICFLKKVSEYDQEIPQLQTADNPMALRGRATQPSRDTRKTNLAKQPALSSPSR